MSGGGGGGRQMPMASNRGQQMQNPQMGFGQSALGQMQGGQSAVGQMGQMQGGMFGQGGNQITPQNPAALFSPETYQQPFGSGGQMPQMAQQVSSQPMMGGGSNPYTQQVMALEAQRLTQQAQQAQQMPPQAFDQFRQQEMMMGGGMGSTPSFASKQDYDNFMAQGGMQGVQDRMAGIGALGGQYPGLMDMVRGLPGGPPLVQNPGPGRSYPINDGPMMPPRMGDDGVGDGTGPGGMGFGPRLGFNDFRKGDLPGRGMPPGYGPTKGPIDGRKLRDMMDIRTRRPIDGLPNALENNLPPSLKRPTQNRRG
jgi:hypothetical protein